MAQQQLIALTDREDNVSYFDADDLTVQLTGAGIATGADTVKAAARQFAKVVKQMRDAQKRQRSETMEALKRKAADEAAFFEKSVDGMVQTFLQTIEKL